MGNPATDSEASSSLLPNHLAVDTDSTGEVSSSTSMDSINRAPTETITLLPSDPYPYAQLCFNGDKSSLITLLVGSRRRCMRYFRIEGYADGLAKSSSLSSDDDSESSGSSWTTTSRGSYETYGDSNGDIITVQDIVWFNGAWSMNDSQDHSEIHQALLGSSAGFEKADVTTTCGKLVCNLPIRETINKCHLGTLSKAFALAVRHNDRPKCAFYVEMKG